VQTAFSGPLPAGEGLRIVDDDAVSKLICDDRTIPVEATEEIRNVPAGVFRGVFVRDGGRCIAEGCDITAAWCEVMHLTVPYRLNGRLTIDTAGLGCLYHHPKLDHEGWKITWIDRPPHIPPGSTAQDHPPDRTRPPDQRRQQRRPPDRPPGSGGPG
jgi:hypothetical protein